ncbi:MAG: hypothetical protein EA370_01020 [Wenzhouxiangella sp.]|nr:MAG: hypothetical protein EA370_01020 [Wenzhouxiangella sp.]
MNIVLDESNVCILNSGGPMSRTRTESVRLSLLGLDDGPIRCPLRLRLALWFGDDDPREIVTGLLEDRGLRVPDDLRDIIDLPPGPLLCRPLPDDCSRLNVATADPDEVLHQALLLGLCTAHRYDPQRPVLWTRASLGRALELYDPRGFYA